MVFAQSYFGIWEELYKLDFICFLLKSFFCFSCKALGDAALNKLSLSGF